MSRLAAAVTAAFLALAIAGTVSATSCVPIEMQLRDLQPGTVVLVGTVTGRDIAGVQVRVDRWFAGEDPRDSLVIPIAAPGEPVIVEAWDPVPGQTWFIIGDRIAPATVDSNVCRLVPIDATIVTTATEILGSPKLPPFETPEEPTGGVLGTGLSPVIVGAVAVLGVLAGLGAVVILQRRPA